MFNQSALGIIESSLELVQALFMRHLSQKSKKSLKMLRANRYYLKKQKCEKSLDALIMKNLSLFL